MFWTDSNTACGMLVAAPTTSGDCKDVHIITGLDDQWSTVSLMDGLHSDPCDKSELIARLNANRFAPIAKVFGTSESVSLPENRSGLPVVAVLNVRGAR